MVGIDPYRNRRRSLIHKSGLLLKTFRPDYQQALFGQARIYLTNDYSNPSALSDPGCKRKNSGMNRFSTRLFTKFPGECFSFERTSAENPGRSGIGVKTGGRKRNTPSGRSEPVGKEPPFPPVHIRLSITRSFRCRPGKSLFVSYK